MQYHALALAVNAGEVDLIGLEGAPALAAPAAQPRIRWHRLPDRGAAAREGSRGRRFLALSLARVIRQAISLFIMLLRVPKPDAIMVQTPPAIPTLAVAWLAARLRGARFVIDWHNLAHTVLAVKLGEGHRAVRATKRSERRWARRADAHLTVSRALAEHLDREYDIHAMVVYDRPLASQPRPDRDRMEALRSRLARELSLPSGEASLVVAPTSWTPDEDFDLLIEALERTERALAKGVASTGDPERLPSRAPRSLNVILTGRGPAKAEFERRIARRTFQQVAVRTAWLEPQDYPVLLAMADLGLCLHQSSSGLDLPIKLADLRGAGVPVCALDYAPVLAEAMVSGQHGVTFKDAGQLSQVLIEVATRSESGDSPIARSRAWLSAHPVEPWEDHWRIVAAPVLSARSA
jgi:beta-1,4-mannosyltransferase